MTLMRKLLAHFSKTAPACGFYSPLVGRPRPSGDEFEQQELAASIIALRFELLASQRFAAVRPPQDSRTSSVSREGQRSGTDECR
jgi:hypothetical protein